MTAYYVDNEQGHDHWAGSSGQPLATLYGANIATAGDTIWVKRTSSPYQKGYNYSGGAYTYTHSTRTLAWTGHSLSVGDLVYMVGVTGNQYKAARVQSVAAGVSVTFESPMTGFADGTTSAVYAGKGRMGHAAQQDIIASGSVVANKSVKIKGYNTTIGDMDRGGGYYQDPLDCHISGVDDTKKVKVDGNAVAAAIWKIYGDNVTVENFWFTNTAASNEFWTMDTASNLTFMDCAFTAGRQNNSEAGLAVFYYSCYVTTSQNCFVVGGSTAWVIGCVVAPTTYAFNISTTATSLMHFRIIGNLVIGGTGGVSVNVIDAPVLILNNTFYNQATWCTAMNSAVGSISYTSMFNNIFMPQAGGKVIQINATGGTYVHDYNCIYGADGNPLSTPFATLYGGGQIPVLGDHSLEADPMFADAASSDFRPRNPDVLRGGRGDVLNTPVPMGAVLQKYQFANRARTANMARLGIIR